MGRTQRYALVSTMEQEVELQRVLSRHRTLRGASSAQERLNRSVARKNPGGNAYYPTGIRHGDKSSLTEEERAELDAIRGI